MQRSSTRVFVSVVTALILLSWLAYTWSSFSAKTVSTDPLSLQHVADEDDDDDDDDDDHFSLLQDALVTCESKRGHYIDTTIQALDVIAKSNVLASRLKDKSYREWKATMQKLRVYAKASQTRLNRSSSSMRQRIEAYTHVERVATSGLSMVQCGLKPLPSSPPPLPASPPPPPPAAVTSTNPSCPRRTVLPYFHRRTNDTQDTSAFRSRLPTSHEMAAPSTKYIVEELLKETLMIPHHRKQWEYVFIVRALQASGKLAQGHRALVFAAGTEPLVSYVASKGVAVLATDQDTKKAMAQGWTNTNEHAGSLMSLHRAKIIDKRTFKNNVRFRFLDMNYIDAVKDLGKFDILWSTCSLEHVGSIRLGQRFFLNSLQLLRPGGIAVHTIEMNIGSFTDTVEEGATVLWRRKDVDELIRDTRLLGYTVKSVNYFAGDAQEDLFVDKPPYGLHMKLMIDCFPSTSVGIIAYRDVK